MRVFVFVLVFIAGVGLGAYLNHLNRFSFKSSYLECGKTSNGYDAYILKAGIPFGGIRVATEDKPGAVSKIVPVTRYLTTSEIIYLAEYLGLEVWPDGEQG